MNSLANVSITVQNAVAFLTAPLLDSSIPLHAVDKLQRALISSLNTRYTTLGQWDITHPDVGSEARAIHLSTACPPPSYVARACEAANVDWSTWLFMLGGGHGLDLDLYVDPGRVTVCFRKHGCPASDLVTVWKQADIVKPTRSTTHELLSYDDDSEIFALINQKVNSPSWVASWSKNSNGVTPPKTQSCLPSSVKVPRLSPVPQGVRKAHSRSSSSSSLFSGTSGSPSEDEVSNWRMPRAPSSGSSAGSDTSSNPGDVQKPKRNGRATVMVDVSKTAVNNYDGGKTRVVGGGVMLGCVSGGVRRRN